MCPQKRVGQCKPQGWGPSSERPTLSWAAQGQLHTLPSHFLDHFLVGGGEVGWGLKVLSCSPADACLDLYTPAPCTYCAQKGR